MTSPALPHRREDRYFEDYVPNSTHEYGSIGVSEDEIIEFAKKFDPQAMHIDPKAAGAGDFHGLIASGWHSAGLMMRLFVERFLPTVASIVSPGVDEVRWILPVRPGDSLRIRVTITEATRSRSKPDRGLIRTFIEMLNQTNEIVMTLRGMNLIRCRTAAPPAPKP
jgi:acyl dehydratase